MHTTYRRYVAHKASLYSTLQSLFEPVFFSGCQLIPDLNRLYCKTSSRNCGHGIAARQIRVIRRLTTTLSHISPQKKLSTGSPSPRATMQRASMEGPNPPRGKHRQMMRAAESYETEAPPQRHQYVKAGPDDDGAERQIVKAGPYHDDTEPSRRKVVYAGSDENESLTRPSHSRSTRVNDPMSSTRSTQASALSRTALVTADTPSSLVLPAKSDAHPASAGNFVPGGTFHQLDYMQQTPRASSTSGFDEHRGLFPISIPPEQDASLAIADRTAVEQAQHSKKGENPRIHNSTPRLPLDAPRSLSVAESSLDAEYALPVYPDSFEEIDIDREGDTDDGHGWRYFPCEFCQRKVRGGRACRCPQVMRRHGFFPPL